MNPCGLNTVEMQCKATIGCRTLCFSGCGFSLTAFCFTTSSIPDRTSYDASRAYDSNRALTVISALNSFDTGHPVSAPFTAASNFA
jgi:hypothetical protein